MYEKTKAGLLSQFGLVTDLIGGAMPFQADGRTPEGDCWYFRFRHDEAAFYVYPDGDEFSRFANTTQYNEAHDVLGREHAGDLDDDQALALIAQMWTGRRPKADWASTSIERLAQAVDELTARMKAGAEED